MPLGKVFGSSKSDCSPRQQTGHHFALQVLAKCLPLTTTTATEVNEKETTQRLHVSGSYTFLERSINSDMFSVLQHFWWLGEKKSMHNFYHFLPNHHRCQLRAVIVLIRRNRCTRTAVTFKSYIFPPTQKAKFLQTIRNHVYFGEC
nr:PREDICTED: uncharacterized protein LOC103280470 isoform X2 [Anolis carolinensis]|eukprot:XP_016852496.1 PREDICTED: uncharacterized protein LOC103280470 isoform X2 [Anolis carolinensis]